MNPAAPLSLGGRAIGAGQPCFVIAEAGVNHNGDKDLAFGLIDAAAEAGADAVKFQTFDPDRHASPSAPTAEYQRKAAGNEGSQRCLLRQLALSPEMHRALMAKAADRGIIFLSSPFDEESADLLSALGVPGFKLPSGEITNLPFLAHVARKGKPVILSTGMSDIGEVEAAVAAMKAVGNRDLVLLHCVSAYPAPAADANLKAMATLAAAFGLPVGFSDHTPGIHVSIAAAALGAVMIEKHLTLDCNLPGPDHRASLELEDFRALIDGVRLVESALGDGIKQPRAVEAEIATVARKSLVAACAIPAGTRIQPIFIARHRPGTGLAPADLPFILGRVTKRDIAEGEIIALDMLA